MRCSCSARELQHLNYHIKARAPKVSRRGAACALTSSPMERAHHDLAAPAKTKRAERRDRGGLEPGRKRHKKTAGERQLSSRLSTSSNLLGYAMLTSGGGGLYVRGALQKRYNAMKDVASKKAKARPQAQNRPAVANAGMIHEQIHVVRLELRYLQIINAKAALQELCDRRDAKYEATRRSNAELLKLKEMSALSLRSMEELEMNKYGCVTDHEQPQSLVSIGNK
ncbi:hypothetical protein C8R44DRAFT_860592 [Mycena epipterygia]|nr:hypothetical protein C8R44DRAFT_860592 [Mycena epipterygia]